MTFDSLPYQESDITCLCQIVVGVAFIVHEMYSLIMSTIRNSTQSNKIQRNENFITSAVCPIKYSHGFVVLCLVVVISLINVKTLITSYLHVYLNRLIDLVHRVHLDSPAVIAKHFNPAFHNQDSGNPCLELFKIHKTCYFKKMVLHKICWSKQKAHRDNHNSSGISAIGPIYWLHWLYERWIIDMFRFIRTTQSCCDSFWLCAAFLECRFSIDYSFSQNIQLLQQ